MQLHVESRCGTRVSIAESSYQLGFINYLYETSFDKNPACFTYTASTLTHD